VGGGLADRFEKTRVMIGADLLRFGAVRVVAISSGTVPRLVLAGLAMLMGVGTGLFRPAYGAAVPEMLPDCLVRSGNALRSASGLLAAVVGPALGGGVLAVMDAQNAFVFDAFPPRPQSSPRTLRRAFCRNRGPFPASNRKTSRPPGFP